MSFTEMSQQVQHIPKGAFCVPQKIFRHGSDYYNSLNNSNKLMCCFSFCSSVSKEKP